MSSFSIKKLDSTHSSFFHLCSKTSSGESWIPGCLFDRSIHVVSHFHYYFVAESELICPVYDLKNWTIFKYQLKYLSSILTKKLDFLLKNIEPTRNRSRLKYSTTKYNGDNLIIWRITWCPYGQTYVFTLFFKANLFVCPFPPGKSIYLPFFPNQGLAHHHQGRHSGLPLRVNRKMPKTSIPFLWHNYTEISEPLSLWLLQSVNKSPAQLLSISAQKVICSATLTRIWIRVIRPLREIRIFNSCNSY